VKYRKRFPFFEQQTEMTQDKTRESRRWILKNANLLYGPSFELLTGQDVTVASTGAISRIAPSSPDDVEEDVLVVDVSKYLILPGLVNACVDLRGVIVSDCSLASWTHSFG
jgi:hypothetical protein